MKRDHLFDNRLARLVVAGNVLLAAALAVIPVLLDSGSARGLPVNLIAATWGLYDCVVLLVLFLVPGSALALLFSRRRIRPVCGLLAAGFAINIVLLVATTTILKFCGMRVDRGLLTAVLVFSLCAGLVALLRVRVPAVANNLPVSAPFLSAALLSFVILFFFLRGYVSRGPEYHWLIEHMNEIEFPTAGADNSLSLISGDDGGVPDEDGFVVLDEGAGNIVFPRAKQDDKTIPFRCLVKTGTPGRFTVAAGGEEKHFEVPQPFLERGREVRFQNHAVVDTTVSLPSGETVVALEFSDRAGRPAPCSVLHFSGLDRKRFTEKFTRRYRFVNFVLMYDIMETEDFVSNLTRRAYIYHSEDSPEMAGYAVTNPPLSYIFSSFGYILMGEEMAAVNKVAFAIFAAELLVALYLTRAGLETRGARRLPSLAMLLGFLALTTLMTVGVSLHFMTHFMLLCCLISWGFLLKKRAGMFVVFSLMACLSAWAGYYFCLLGLACYALVWGDFRWSLRRCVSITAGVGLFIAALLSIGWFRGMLRPWLDVILWENFRRFGTTHLYQAGSGSRFMLLAVAGSGCLPLGLLFTRERRTGFFLILSALYLATLLLAPSNEWKMHYLPTLCIPLMVGGGRALTAAGGKSASVARAVALAGACAGLFYSLRLASAAALLL